MYYSDKAEDLARLIEDNDEELRAKLSNGDWLHIYASSIKDYALDMGAAMRFSLKEGREGNPNDKMLADMQSLFGGNKNLTWDSLAEFSAYLSDLYDVGNQVTNAKGAKESYEVVSDYVVKQMEIVDAEDLLRSQSLYEMITHTKKNFGQVGEKKSGLKAELRDFANLQQRLSNEKKLKETVRSLAKSAPKDIAQLVNDITNSSSKYVNFAELEKLLLAKDYEKLRSTASLS
jgi:hypothetical protein